MTKTTKRKAPTLASLAKAVQEEARLAACNLCPPCYSGDEPERDDDGRWWHTGYNSSTDEDEDRECDAQEVRELLYRIAENTGLTLAIPNG